MSRPAWWRRARASKSWRLPATALGFIIFGAGSAVLSVTLFPALYFAPVAPARKRALTRRLISRVFRTYVALLQWLGLLSYEFHNERALLAPNQLIVANHPSLLDVVFIIALAGNASCIVKGSLWRNPFTAVAVQAAGYISNDRADLVDACIETLQQGESLIIFPEGTRSRPGEPLHLHRGAANIALGAGVAVSPVTIQCRPAMLLKKQKWYQIASEPSHYIFQVMPKVPVAPYTAKGQMQSTASRQLTRDLTDFFQHCNPPKDPAPTAP